MTSILTDQTPRELGYRMPAEWEKQASVWLQWPGRHPAAAAVDFDGAAFADQWRDENRQTQDICNLAWNVALGLSQFRVTSPAIEVPVGYCNTPFIIDDEYRAGIPVPDIDDGCDMNRYPGHFEAEVIHHRKNMAALFIAVREDIEPRLLMNFPTHQHPGLFHLHLVGIVVFAARSRMATRSSMINNNRNPGLSQQDVEQALGDYLGVRHFIWLSGAPAEVCEHELGDSTDYHIDIAARFVDKNKVLYAWTDNKKDPRYPYLAKHFKELQNATDEDGNPLILEPVYLPEVGVFAIGERDDPRLGGGSSFTDASYLNYLVSNNIVLVPAFGNVNDAPAQTVLSQCFPDRKIIPVPAVSLTAEGGAIHCVTQQQPAA